MALINCPDCGKKISDKAEMCNGCGFPINLKNIQHFSPKKKKSSAIKVLIWSVLFLCAGGVGIHFLYPILNLNSVKQFERKTISTLYGKEVCTLETFTSVKMPDGKVKDFLNGQYTESFELTKQILVQGFYSYDSTHQRSCKNGEWVEYDEYGKLLNKSYYDVNYNLNFDVDKPIKEQFYSDNGTVSKIIIRDPNNPDPYAPITVKNFYPNGQLKHHRYYDNINGRKQLVNLYYNESGKETNEDGRKYWSEVELGLLLVGANSREIQRLLGKPDNLYSGLRGEAYRYRNLIKQNNKVFDGWIYCGGFAAKENFDKVVKVSIHKLF